MGSWLLQRPRRRVQGPRKGRCEAPPQWVPASRLVLVRGGRLSAVTRIVALLLNGPPRCCLVDALRVDPDAFTGAWTQAVQEGVRAQVARP